MDTQLYIRPSQIDFTTGERATRGSGTSCQKGARNGSERRTVACLMGCWHRWHSSWLVTELELSALLW